MKLLKVYLYKIAQTILLFVKPLFYSRPYILFKKLFDMLYQLTIEKFVLINIYLCRNLVLFNFKITF